MFRALQIARKAIKLHLIALKHEKGGQKSYIWQIDCNKLFKFFIKDNREIKINQN